MFAWEEIYLEIKTLVVTTVLKKRKLDPNAQPFAPLKCQIIIIKESTKQHAQNKQKSMEERTHACTKNKISTFIKNTNAKEEQINANRNRHSILEEEDTQQEEHNTNPKIESKLNKEVN